ncbi:MAG: hypothetical protein QXQ77_02635 [Candidatus Aenigmatarchaeota archaeon]
MKIKKGKNTRKTLSVPDLPQGEIVFTYSTSIQPVGLNVYRIDGAYLLTEGRIPLDIT